MAAVTKALAINDGGAFMAEMQAAMDQMVEITIDGDWFATLRIAVGEEGSGIRGLAVQLLEANEMGRPHLDGVKSRVLRNTSSLAFGGADLRTGYLGCLLGESIAQVSMPVAGHPPVHWNYPSAP